MLEIGTMCGSRTCQKKDNQCRDFKTVSLVIVCIGYDDFQSYIIRKSLSGLRSQEEHPAWAAKLTPDVAQTKLFPISSKQISSKFSHETSHELH